MGLSWRSSSGGGVGHGGVADVDVDAAVPLLSSKTISLDNAHPRRGKPTNHKAFGEAVAILASDGLLALAWIWVF